jgi:hypothetical protein
MRFFLSVINTETTEDYPEREFASMDDLLAYATKDGFDWTSLVVNILKGDDHA